VDKVILNYKHHQALTGTISLPASKSISNRLLMMNTYAGGNISIKGISDASDTLRLSALLTELSMYDPEDEQALLLDAGDAGTALRFILPLLANSPGRFVLTGSERMKQRPIGILVDALRQIGADIQYGGEENYPPLQIRGIQLSGGEIELDAGISSQFASAILMIAPLLPEGVKIIFQNEIASHPYIELTLTLMEKSGIEPEEDETSIYIAPQSYETSAFTVGRDWSSAACWFAMAAMNREAKLLLKGLKIHSIQGDSMLVYIYEILGVETIQQEDGILLKSKEITARTFQFDFFNFPDILPAVAVTCAALKIPAQLTGIRNLRIKESDRIRALQTELLNMGFACESLPDTLLIRKTSPSPDLPQPVKTYNDHRIAMSFAALAIKYGNITIEDPGVVAKSYPLFWEEMEGTGFGISFV